MAIKRGMDKAVNVAVDALKKLVHQLMGKKILQELQAFQQIMMKLENYFRSYGKGFKRWSYYNRRVKNISNRINVVEGMQLIEAMYHIYGNRYRKNGSSSR